ncbi:hypothetical protein Hdeb2414_s0012g00397061 [Helianthus debilis subsp. tardiflorus]
MAYGPLGLRIAEKIIKTPLSSRVWDLLYTRRKGVTWGEFEASWSCARVLEAFGQVLGIIGSLNISFSVSFCLEL